MSFIKSIKKSGSKINLYKLDQEILSKQTSGTTLFSNGINICFLDLETTGLNTEEDKIIEIAIKVVKIDKIDGNIISFEFEYGCPLEWKNLKKTDYEDLIDEEKLRRKKEKKKDSIQKGRGKLQ